MKLERLKRSRTPPSTGDIFTYSLGDSFGFGRVVAADLKMFSWSVVLVYIYDSFQADRVPSPSLSRDNLLFEPIFVSPDFWRKGWFETIENRPLKADDAFEEHSFWHPTNGCYRDQFGNKVDGSRGVLGNYVVAFVEGVEGRISEALHKRRKKRAAPPPPEE